MDIPAARWHSVITKRRSRRRFTTGLLSKDLLEQVRIFCNSFQPFPHVRVVLIPQPPKKIFRGALGPYGKIKGAQSVIAFIGNMISPHVQEQVGYTGEGVILEMTALKLDTCWVGGFFRPEVVRLFTEIKEHERVLAVTPIGYAAEKLSIEERLMTGFGLTHHRRPLKDLVTGLEESVWPPWIKAALEAARLAPSAVNRQPWRFHVETNSITVSVNRFALEFGLSKRLCCGIAMLHIEVAALADGRHGKWEFLEHPQVARFVVDGNG
jgi:nitroreductase